jgi:hypothetical protein
MGFEQSVEVKSWSMLKGTYLPTLFSSLSDLKTQVQQMQTHASEFAGLVQQFIDAQSSMPRSSSGSSITEMSTQVLIDSSFECC